MKKIILFLMVLISVPSLAQDVIEDTLAVVENEVVPEGNYLTINTDQQHSMIYVNDVFVGFNKVAKLLNVGEAYTWKIECDMYQPVNGKDTMSSGEAVVLNVEMQAAFGILNVTSSPEDNAVIFIDNKHVGNTPLASIKMPLGQHKMLVFKNSYDPYHYDFEIIGNDTVNVDVEMISNVKNVIIVAEDMSEIYVDNEFKGIGNWDGYLAFGAHIFEAKKVSHKPALLLENIKQDENIDTVFLSSPTPIYGSLDISTTPSGASVYIANEYIGKTPLVENILIGEYELTLKNEACADIIMNINVTENNPLLIDEKFDPSKKIFVKTDKSGDSLFVNDIYVGLSPQHLYLTYNVHNIKAVRGKYDVTNEIDVLYASDTIDVFVGKEMKIVTDREKDKVYLDEKKIGKSPCTTKISYGTHELKVTRGKHVYKKMLVVEDDGIEEVKVKLGENVTFKTTNKGDKVYVDNKYIGKAPVTKYVYYGNRDVKIVRDKELENTHKISVREDDDINEYTLYIGQLVTLESNKKGDDIYIDGVKKGRSPLEYDMPIGNHEILVKRNRKTDIQKLYIIKDGQTHFYFKPTRESIDEFISQGMKFFTLNASRLDGKNSYGISLGSYKKVGWHFSLLTNFDIVDGEYQTGLNQFLTKYDEISPDAVDFTGKQLNSRLSATAGLMFKVAGPVYLKLGGGYAMYSTFDQAANEEWYKSVSDINYNGLLLTGGLQFNLRNFVISTDLNTTKDFEFMEFKVGIGFSKKKNK